MTTGCASKNTVVPDDFRAAFPASGRTISGNAFQFTPVREYLRRQGKTAESRSGRDAPVQAADRTVPTAWRACLPGSVIKQIGGEDGKE